MGIELRPQEGAQMAFLATPANWAFYGGAAFSGKTYAMLLEALRHINNPRFSAVFFRRNKEDITKTGALWDTAGEIYPQVGGMGIESSLEYRFASGMSVSMDGMKDEKDRFKWQGTQIPLICFDEATHFTPNQVFYMMSRNRSSSGIPGYMRFGCNPDPDSFIREILDWWIGSDGFPIMERSGKIRWFVRRGFNLQWADTAGELRAKFGTDQEPKSVTFIPAKAYDNKIGLANDPGYLSNLKALSYVDRMQLLEGNWNVRAVAGSYFKREWFKRVSVPPVAGRIGRIRFWDRAATEKTDANDPDQTCCILMSKYGDGRYIVEDYKTMFATPYDVEKAMLETAEADGKEVTIGWMKDPGSAGVKESQDTAFKLSGYPLFILEGSQAQQSKELRAKGISSQCQVGNVAVVEAEWNNALFRNLEGFPEGRYKEEADCMSGCEMGLNTGPAATTVKPREHDWSVRGRSRMVC